MTTKDFTRLAFYNEFQMRSICQLLPRSLVHDHDITLFSTTSFSGWYPQKNLRHQWVLFVSVKNRARFPIRKCLRDQDLCFVSGKVHTVVTAQWGLWWQWWQDMISSAHYKREKENTQKRNADASLCPAGCLDSIRISI